MKMTMMITETAFTRSHCKLYQPTSVTIL